MVWHWKTDKVAVLVAFRLQIIQEDMGIRTGPFCGCAGNTYEIGYDEGLWYSLSTTKNICTSGLFGSTYFSGNFSFLIVVPSGNSTSWNGMTQLDELSTY